MKRQHGYELRPGNASRCLLVVLIMCSFAVRAQPVTPILDWQVLLEDPDPLELTELASEYERGVGYRRDYGRARQLYCAAARLGHMPAQRRLAWMYANGLGAPRDTDLATAWLEVAAANGDTKARRFLAFIGEEVLRRKPRCTYESRFDAYAVATVFGKDLDKKIDMESPTRKQITAWVGELAPGYGLDPDLVLAIIEVGSDFDPQAGSSEEAQGLMQLKPSTAARFGVRDRTNPAQSLHGGMAYLRWLQAFFQDDLRLALAAYQAGEQAVEKYLGVPPFEQTQVFIRQALLVYGRENHHAPDPPAKAGIKNIEGR